jgi:type VI protein secretion system component VasF
MRAPARIRPEHLTPWMARLIAIVAGVIIYFLLPHTLDRTLRALAA